MTKDFKLFLQQFSAKIESVRGQPHFSPTDLGRLDETIQGLLELAERVYTEDVDNLLGRLSIEETLAEMKSTLEGHLCNIGNISIDIESDRLKIFYNNTEHSIELLDIPGAMRKYFQIQGNTEEFYFISAYLARNDNYDVIQIYHFIRTRTH